MTVLPHHDSTWVAFERDEALKNLAAKQAGFFTATQARELGYTYSNQNYHVKQGNWRREEYSIYRLPWYPDHHEAKLTKCCLWSRNRQGEILGVVSHTSALYFHGLWPQEPALVSLTVPPDFRKKPPENIHLNKAELTPADCQPRGLLRVTTPERTIVDERAFLAEQGRLAEICELAIDMGVLDRSRAETRGWLPAAPQYIAPLEKEIAMPDVEIVAPLGPAATPPPARPLRGREFATRVRRRAQAGFTLVELLVVTAIISVLAAMLLPVLEKAHQAAYTTACANQERQLFLIADEYRNANRLWPHYYTGVDNSYWFQSLFPNKGSVGNYMTGPWRTGTKHDPDYKLLDCPANKDAWPSGWCDWRNVNFCVNAVGGGKVPGCGGPLEPRKASAMPWTVDGSAVCYWDNTTIINYTDLVHSNGLNTLFFDGHVRWLHGSICKDILLDQAHGGNGDWP